MKQKISKQSSSTEQLSPVLEKLKREVSGFKVPVGYFDSLSPRIVDEIKKQENRSQLRAIIPQFRKPLVWRSAMAMMIFAAMVVFYLLVKKDSAVLPATDEYTEINMSYDASYAEEALLNESNIIDNELENNDLSYIASASYNGISEPTIDEITEYLKEQEIDTDILNEY